MLTFYGSVLCNTTYKHPNIENVSKFIQTCLWKLCHFHAGIHVGDFLKHRWSFYHTDGCNSTSSLRSLSQDKPIQSLSDYSQMQMTYSHNSTQQFEYKHVQTNQVSAADKERTGWDKTNWSLTI